MAGPLARAYAAASRRSVNGLQVLDESCREKLSSIRCAHQSVQDAPMTMNDDERKFLSDQIAEKFAWFNRGSRNWSFVFNWSLAAAALLSAAAAIVLKITLLQEYIGADGAKDIAACAAAAATVITALAAGGGFGRKWQANRVSRGRIERLRICLSDPEADAKKIRSELADIIQKHDEAIIGSPV